MRINSLEIQSYRPSAEKLFFHLPDLLRKLTDTQNVIPLSVGEIVVFEPRSNAGNIVFLKQEDWPAADSRLIEQVWSISKEHQLGFDIRIPMDHLDRFRESLTRFGFVHKQNMIGVVRKIEEKSAPLGLEAFIPKTEADRQEYIDIFAECFKYPREAAHKFCTRQIFLPEDQCRNRFFLYRPPGTSRAIAISQTVVFSEFPQLGYFRLEGLRNDERGKGLSHGVFSHLAFSCREMGAGFHCALVIESERNQRLIEFNGASEICRFSVWNIEEGK